MKNHCIISGTGRAGTSLLVRIFTELGLPTGFSPNNVDDHIDPIAHAGLEHALYDADAPYIVKDPWIATYIQEIAISTEVCIDFAIIPVRSLPAAAASRVSVQRKNSSLGINGEVPGGLVLTQDAAKQPEILSALFYNLVYHLVRMDVPIIFLEFPRFALDPDYLFSKISAIFPDIDQTEFLQVVHRVVRPELISEC